MMADIIGLWRPPPRKRRRPTLGRADLRKKAKSKEQQKSSGSAPGPQEAVLVEVAPGLVLEGRLVARRGADVIIKWPNGTAGCIRADRIWHDDLFGWSP